MKVMLIDPPGFEGIAIGRILGSFGTNKANQVWPPYDLQIFAGYCKKNGHDFKILDANNLKMNYGEVKKIIAEYNPDWVIYLTCFPNFELDANVARIAKEVNPKIKTACMSLSIFSVEDPVKRMSDSSGLDFLPWGEPEIALMKLINNTPVQKVKGIYYRDSKGKIKFTGGTTERVMNLNELGIPVHYALPYKIYKCPLSISLPMTIVNCSRGCINSCVHCQAGNFQKPMRYRSVESVLEELDQIKKLGIKEIKFYDCSLPTNQRFLRELCAKMIEKKYNFTWNCNSRAEFINEEILKLMKKAGCHTIAIGCESADPEVIKNMKKNETVEQIGGAVKLVKKNGMRVLMYLTFGLEGETEKTMKATFNFAKSLNPEFATFGIAVPAPGTPFYENLKNKKYLMNKKLEFMDPNCLPTYCYPDLSPEKLHGFTRNAYKKYYFRPAYIAMRLNRLRSFTEFKVSAINALNLIKRYQLEKVN